LHTIVAREKKGLIDNMYKRFCFQTKYIKEQFKFYAVGTKVSGISKSSIKNIVLFLPDLLEQKMIANTLNSMDDELQVLETKKIKSIALKQGMMQELLTGKTRLI
jgi:type I restriction enzyme S subunit